MLQRVVVDDADRFIGGLLALTFNSIALKQLVTAFQGVSAPVARLVARPLQGNPRILVAARWKNAPGSSQ
jgi:hypothetical protein